MIKKFKKKTGDGKNGIVLKGREKKHKEMLQKSTTTTRKRTIQSHRPGFASDTKEKRMLKPDGMWPFLLSFHAGGVVLVFGTGGQTSRDEVRKTMSGIRGWGNVAKKRRGIQMRRDEMRWGSPPTQSPSPGREYRKSRVELATL